jgi:vacuolar-type H+-ATPase subunit H
MAALFDDKTRGTCARLDASGMRCGFHAGRRRCHRGMPAAARASMTDARSKPRSELALLVSAEARLDGALAAARAEAAAVVDAARRRAEAGDAALAEHMATQEARIAADGAAEVARQRSVIADAARAEIARYEAVRGDVLAGLVHAVVAKLAAVVSTGEDPRPGGEALGVPTPRARHSPGERTEGGSP